MTFMFYTVAFVYLLPCSLGASKVLDVFGIEPLPETHPFWVNENIVIWPHVSAETNIETAAKQVAQAIKLIHSSKIPENKIDLNLGY